MIDYSVGMTPEQYKRFADTVRAGIMRQKEWSEDDFFELLMLDSIPKQGVKIIKGWDDLMTPISAIQKYAFDSRTPKKSF
jgi:folate-dependent tRNA-U54 methylase TrmFO/GidA